MFAIVVIQAARNSRAGGGGKLFSPAAKTPAVDASSSVNIGMILPIIYLMRRRSEPLGTLIWQLLNYLMNAIHCAGLAFQTAIVSGEP